MEEQSDQRMKRFALIHSYARMKAGRSQEYMALELGVAKKTIQNWEKGISSPSFFQSLEWFRVLNLNPFPYYFMIVYPNSIKNVKSEHEAEKINADFDILIRNISVNDKKALLYLYYGDHGSSPHSVIQMMLAHLHTPIKARIANAFLISNVYKLEKELGEIICPDEALPDQKDLQNAIDRAYKSVLQHEESYIQVEIESAE